MRRFYGITLILWGVWLGVCIALRPATLPDCEPLCWGGLYLGMEDDQAAAFLAAQGIMEQPTFTARSRGYEWQTPAGGRVVVLLGKGAVIRLDANWQRAEPRPTLAQVLQVFGAPTAVHLQGERVANIRRLTGFVLYQDTDGDTVLVSLRRVSNDPATFGEFRLLPSDRVINISRYPNGTLPQPADPWRGLGRYQVLQTCC